MKLLTVITACMVANLYRERIQAERARKGALESARQKWDDAGGNDEGKTKYAQALNDCDRIIEPHEQMLEALETEMRKEGINVKSSLITAFKEWAKR